MIYYVPRSSDLPLSTRNGEVFIKGDFLLFLEERIEDEYSYVIYFNLTSMREEEARKWFFEKSTKRIMTKEE